MQSIFGTDGIRGRFNVEITESLAYKVGYALGLTLENNNPILIGRDTRISGDILLKAIAKGINASGKKFINLGICPTPAIPFLIQRQDLPTIGRKYLYPRRIGVLMNTMPDRQEYSLDPLLHS